MLGSLGLSASGLEATMREEVENAEGARDEGRRHSRRPSTAPPHIFSLPPSSSASRAEARGPAASRAEMVNKPVLSYLSSRLLPQYLYCRDISVPSKILHSC
jgi:hypothetical protein